MGISKILVVAIGKIVVLKAVTAMALNVIAFC
jgi:hypothetical protein